MTDSLTDRYVAATLRALPERQRADIEVELRGSIADAIDDRLESGVDRGAAEHAVLKELGPPARLSASYTDRPQMLISPAVYPDYIRVAKVLLTTAVPLWFLILGLTTFVDGGSALSTFGAALYGAVEIGVAITFLTTVVFVGIDRARSAPAGRGTSWDPSSLPAVPNRKGHLGELIGGVLFLVVISGMLVYLQTAGRVVGPGGEPVGPIDAELWASGTFYIALLFAVVSICFQVFARYTGWSVANAVATTVLDLLFMVPAVWITASGRLLDESYFAEIGWPAGVGIVTGIVIGLVVVLPGLDTVDGWVRASRSRRTR